MFDVLAVLVDQFHIISLKVIIQFLLVVVCCVVVVIFIYLSTFCGVWCDVWLVIVYLYFVFVTDVM